MTKGGHGAAIRMSLPDSFLDPESLERAARATREASDFDAEGVEFEIRFFDRILRRSPDFIDVLRCQGELLSRKHRHAEALVIDQRLAALCPADCIIRYNLACSLAMAAEPEAAIVELRRAFERGYVDMEHLQIDPDLDNLRDLPAFHDLLKEYGRHK